MSSPCRVATVSLSLQYTAAGWRDNLSGVRGQIHVFTLYDFICTTEIDQSLGGTKLTLNLLNLTIVIYRLNNGRIRCRNFNYPRARETRVLWDKFLDSYKDNNATKNAWQEILIELT